MIKHICISFAMNYPFMYFVYFSTGYRNTLYNSKNGPFLRKKKKKEMNVKTFFQFVMSFDFSYTVLLAYFLFVGLLLLFVLFFWPCRPFSFLVGQLLSSFCFTIYYFWVY